MGKYSTKLLILLSLICLVNCVSENELLNNSDKGNIIVNMTATYGPTAILNKHLADIKNSTEHSEKYSTDMEEFQNIMFEYVDDVLNRNKIDIMPGVYVEKKNSSASGDKIEKKSFERSLVSAIKDFTDTHVIKIELSRAMTGTGRLFFFKGKQIDLRIPLSFYVRRRFTISYKLIKIIFN